MQISPTVYRKIEQNKTKLTVDRLFQISEILQVKLEDILGIKADKFYKQEFKDNSQNFQEIQHLHQENKEIYEKLIQSKDEQIALLKSMLGK